jgi:adenylosuccinate lyase
LATTIRLMAGIELVTEGFKEGQVGSSAMPHKMNTRSCERVNGLQVVLRGYASMGAELAGAQWNEGDVFCSVVRRVALPDAFFAIDGQIETFLTVLDEFGAYPAVIQRELDRYLPFLATTGPDCCGAGSGRAGRGHQGACGVGARSMRQETTVTTCSTRLAPTTTGPRRRHRSLAERCRSPSGASRRPRSSTRSRWASPGSPMPRVTGPLPSSDDGRGPGWSGSGCHPVGSNGASRRAGGTP